MKNATVKNGLLRFVTPRIVKLLENSNPAALEKVEKEVAILFLDLEGCSILCENLSPKEMNRLIEYYFSRFFDVIQKYRGTVNEIMGDGFMAIFEANDSDRDIHDATSAAVELRRLVLESRKQRVQNRYNTEVHIGLHAGNAFVGFTRFRAKVWERWTYTASGPVVNIAARLCQIAPGGSIFISEKVAAIAQHHFRLEPLGPKKLKNVNQPVIAFNVLD